MDINKFKNETYRKSIFIAWIGLNKALKIEKNFKFHIIIGLFTLFIDILLGIRGFRLSLLVITAFNVLSCEIFNTSIERVCDIITKDYSEEIKIVKDMAAGGVLMNGISFFIVQAILLLEVLFC